MRRILVLRGGALGDLIVTLPALAMLRRRWPGAHIELVGNATAGVLARDTGLVNVVSSQHQSCWAALYTDAPLEPMLAARLAAFDLVLSFWPDTDGDLRRRFPLRDGQIYLSAPAEPRTTPAARHFCEPLAALGLQPAELRFPLGRPREGANLIVLHPGSGSPRKNWPLDRWTALARKLADLHPGRVRVVTGPAEERINVTGFPDVWPNPTLPELLEKFRDCRLFVGHDTGLGHVAAALGIPCVLLFGPTDPAVWAPPAPSVQVVRRSHDLSSITLGDVLEAVRRQLPAANRRSA